MFQISFDCNYVFFECMYISIYHSFRNIEHHWVFQKFLQYIIRSHKEHSRNYRKTNFIQMTRGWVVILIWSLLLDVQLQINLETSFAPVWWFMNNQICNYFLSNCDDLGIRGNNHERHNQKMKKSGFFPLNYHLNCPKFLWFHLPDVVYQNHGPRFQQVSKHTSYPVSFLTSIRRVNEKKTLSDSFAKEFWMGVRADERIRPTDEWCAASKLCVFGLLIFVYVICQL